MELCSYQLQKTFKMELEACQNTVKRHKPALQLVVTARSFPVSMLSHSELAINRVLGALVETGP